MVAVMVNAMDSDSTEDENKVSQNNKEEIIKEIKSLRQEIKDLKELKTEMKIRDERGKNSSPSSIKP